MKVKMAYCAWAAQAVLLLAAAAARTWKRSSARAAG